MILRSLPVLALLLSLASATAADAPRALPVEIDATAHARVAAPAFLDVVTFNVQSEGEKHALTVVSGPGLVRVDEPEERLSVIYDARTQYYVGLEHSNYTWWEFSWPQVREEIEASTRYAARLRDVGPAALDSFSGSAPSTDTHAASSASAGDDGSGYVWHSTLEKKRIATFACTHWVGETASGETIDAWCADGLMAPVETAVATLREINEPMALVPVRNFVPPLAFTAWNAMTKGGITPILITWGDRSDRNVFALTASKTRDGRMDLFTVPKAYVKTTLVTMDGIGDQKPVDAPRGEVKPADHALPLP